MNNQTLSPGNIWEFQHTLTRRLSWGAGISILLGLGVLLVQTRFWNGVAIQFIIWGLIDIFIAWGGNASARRRKSRLSPEQVIASQPAEVRSLGRILWINTGLDVFYMLAGTLLAVFLGIDNPLWLGTGVGILLQGAFLFFFDWYHALRLREYR